jgi:hypothetical protein
MRKTAADMPRSSRRKGKSRGEKAPEKGLEKQKEKTQKRENKISGNKKADPQVGFFDFCPVTGQEKLQQPERKRQQRVRTHQQPERKRQQRERQALQQQERVQELLLLSCHRR